MQGGDADDDGHYFFFSAPASPVHYILRSPPSSTAAASSPCFVAGAPADAAGADFEFAAHGGGPGTKGGVAMSSAEELFVAGRIRVACLSPIRRQDGGEEEEEEEERERDDGRSPRAAVRRARSASPTRSPRGGDRGAFAEPSASSSSSSANNIRRRISLRDLLGRTGGGDCAGADQQASSGAEVTSSWSGYFWPSRPFKKSSPLPPCPEPRPGRRSTSSNRDRAAAVPTAAKRAPGGSARRTTSLPYRQSLVLGCLGFGPRDYQYGLAKSMHPLPSR